MKTKLHIGFILLASLALIFASCGGGGGDTVKEWHSFNAADGLADFLAGTAEGSSASDPVQIKVTGTATWENLLDVLDTADKYLELDLSEWTGTGDVSFWDNTNSKVTASGKKLTSIILPNTMTSIGEDAFHDCPNLASVTIPNSVTSIGEAAFWICTSLESVTIPDSVTSIERYAFANCNSLESVTIGNSVTSIGECAFEGCRLTSITIPNSVTSIGGEAFAYTSLASVTIPDSVTSIERYTFSGCTILVSVTFQGTISNENFDDSAFLGDLKTKYLAGSVGTYTTTALVSGTSEWTKL